MGAAPARPPACLFPASQPLALLETGSQEFISGTFAFTAALLWSLVLD